MNDFDFSAITTSLPYLMSGLQYTVQLTVVACLGGIFFGTLLALARLSSIKPLAMIAAGYVNLMRSIPLILVIFWFYFLVPLVLQSVMGYERPPQVGPDRSAYITFIMFEAAFFCEIMRAGIQSIPKGQVAAAQALGLNYRLTMAKIVLPQAFRNMLPVLLTQTIILFQDTSLVYVLSVTDFLGAASKIAQRDSSLVEMYTFVALVYLAICFSMSMLVKALQKKTQIIR
ncbi:MAG: ABC transporter permease subunit [Burkholderiales bacterium]|jgi:glutamate/aspartate transport system permease protein|uniref:amino acid ABC transporter permease n=1 Tax=Limnobacter sp. TaxID=2003368 RepID=UPI003954134E|nr:ABC transporter permease subunit [Burkholderiales bacterium]